MKSLEDAIAVMKTWHGAIDDRDKSRFAEFLPFNRCADAGLTPADGVTEESWGEIKPWTEEELLKHLREDTEFGLQKAIDQRGISVQCMFFCVNMWCVLLENGLEEHSYHDYGVGFFEKILEHYGWQEDNPSTGLE